MDITEVRIKLMEDAGERLQAFCSITFDDCFVIRDLKIIEGTNGPFVAMPSRKLTGHCPQCSCKNHLRAPYCNQCGQRLNTDRAPRDDDGRAKLYADIAHPINSACREMIQERVTAEFYQELERAKLPGYVSRYDDFDLDEHGPRPNSARSTGSRPPPARPAGTVQPTSRVQPANRVQPAQNAARGPHKLPAAQNQGNHRGTIPQPFVSLPYSSASLGQQLVTTYQQTSEKPVVPGPRVLTPGQLDRTPGSHDVERSIGQQPASVIHQAHDQVAGDNHPPRSVTPENGLARPSAGFGAGIF